MSYKLPSPYGRPGDPPVEYESLLEALKEHRVFDVVALDEGAKFELSEKCDDNFSLVLTRRQLRELGEELIELSGEPPHISV